MAVTIIIHELHEVPKKVQCRETMIRIGRDPDTSHIVLPGSTVSREHAVIAQDKAGGWTVRCLSETNPIIVDGAMVTSGAMLSEGSEMLIGGEHLLIFSLDEYKATSYMGDKSYFSKGECQNCHWKGMISTLRRQPACPRCAGTQLAFETEYKREEAANEAIGGATHAVNALEMKQMLNRLKAAKRSRLERVDGRTEGATRKDLSEQQTLKLGKSPDSHMHFGGFCWGQGVTISWNGKHFLAQSSMVFPGMKVNGEKQKEARLKDGDVLEVGSNRFRFVTE